MLLLCTKEVAPEIHCSKNVAMFQFVNNNVVALEIAISPYLLMEVHPQKEVKGKYKRHLFSTWK